MESKQMPNGMFMPALLDRLCNGGENGKTGKLLSRSAYRQSVLRDLRWLLNCSNLEVQLSLENFPAARASVLNFGIPSYAGSRFTESDLQNVAKAIKEAILQYEPRIIGETLEVKIIREIDEIFLCNQALFRIEASLWFEPYPIDLIIRAQWDSENGTMNLHDSS